MEQVEKPSSTVPARPRVTPEGERANLLHPPAGTHPDGPPSSKLLPATPRVKPRKKFQLLDAFEKPIEWLIRLCGWSSIVGVIAIFIFIFREAAPMVPKLDWIYFFTSPRWIPNPAGD